MYSSKSSRLIVVNRWQKSVVFWKLGYILQLLKELYYVSFLTCSMGSNICSKRSFRISAIRCIKGGNIFQYKYVLYFNSNKILII